MGPRALGDGLRTVAVCRWWGGSDWTRAGNVLRATLAEHCPGWELDFRECQHPKSGKLIGNTLKLASWTDAVDRLPDGTRALLLDADLYVRAPLAQLWEQDFDVAITVRPDTARYPFNCGVVALRVSDKTREFMTLWHAWCEDLWRKAQLRMKWGAKYGGINQASLGALIESGELEGLHVEMLPCAEWNCEDSTWKDSEKARIVHLKDELGRCALNYPGNYAPHVRELASEWRRIEQEMGHG